VIVLRTAGTNCDRETVFAFENGGAQTEAVHINQLFEKKRSLADYHVLAIPGGFTYGDDIMAGRILANELRLRLGDELKAFIRDGKLVIGICNGFQVLVRAGFLPGPCQAAGEIQSVTLTNNDSGKFEDRWVHLKRSGRCVWTDGLDDVLFMPVAHAEGKFVPRDQSVLRNLKENGQVVFRYTNARGEPGTYPVNPNGSLDDIAGITDTTGRVLGMMPHPERHYLREHHPFWTRLKPTSSLGAGASIFKNGLRYVKEKLS